MTRTLQKKKNGTGKTDTGRGERVLEIHLEIVVPPCRTSQSATWEMALKKTLHRPKSLYTTNHARVGNGTVPTVTLPCKSHPFGPLHPFFTRVGLECRSELDHENAFGKKSLCQLSSLTLPTLVFGQFYPRHVPVRVVVRYNCKEAEISAHLTDVAVRETGNDGLWSPALCPCHNPLRVFHKLRCV